MDQIRVLVRRYIGAAWRYRWATVACAWVLSVAGWVGTTFIPNQYEANARVYMDADAVLTPLLHGIAIDPQNNRRLDILQRTLLSRPNLEKLVSNTDLDLKITGPGDLEDLVRQLGSAIRISAQTENLFTISYRNPSPKLAFDVVQSVLTTFIESRAGNSRSEMQNAQVFLDQQLANYETKLRDAEKRRADFRTKYIDLLPSDTTGVSRFEQAQGTVQTLQGQVQDQLVRRDMLKGELASTKPMLVTETDANGVPTGAAGMTPEQLKLKQAEDQLSLLLLHDTDQHPDVIAQRKLITSLKAAAARSVAERAAAAKGTGKPDGAAPNTRSQANPVYEQLKVRLVEAEGNWASLQRQLSDATKDRDRLQEIARGAPGLQAEYTNLNRDYDVLRKNYEELLSRRESMRIGSAADKDADKIKIQIVDPPQVPQNPVAPKRVLLVTGVLLGALGAGFGLALLLAQFDQSFHTLDELRDLGLPVAGSISLIEVTSRIRRMAAAIGFSSALALLCAVYAGLILRLLRRRGMPDTTLEPGHLVERVAERLRGVGGLTTPPPVIRRAEDTGSTEERLAKHRAADAMSAAMTDDTVTPPASAHGQADAADARNGAETMLARVVADAPAGLARAAAELAQPRLTEALAPSPPLELESLERAGLVVGRKLRTRISEEFRVTVGTIMRSLKAGYAPGRGAGNLLMVTSSRPGEGKSFTALNLAGSIAQHTQREVLLVDMDAKQHSLSDQLGLGERAGLIDLAANASMRIEDTVLRTAIPNLSLMPVGTRRGEGNEIGEGTVARPMTSLIERMGRRFPNHLVILDAPPCLSTSDPSTIASFVGQIVLVIEAEKTQKSEVLASLDLIKACQTVTLMLNKIRVTTSYTFGAYHYFGTYS